MIRIIIFFLLALTSLHAWPTSVDQANSLLSLRRNNIVRAWVAKYQYDRIVDQTNVTNGIDDGSIDDHVNRITGFDHWKESSDPKVGIRKMAAGFYAFAHPTEFSDIEFSRLGEPSDISFDEKLMSWKQKALAYLRTVHQYAEVGTHTGATYDGLRFGEADYDFALKELISMVYAFRDYPNILTNQMIEAIILQSFVPPGFNGSITDGKVVASGQDPSVFTTVRNRNGVGFFTIEKAIDWIPDIKIKTTQGETENHVLMVMCWTYLVQNYLEWVAKLPAGHPRKSTLLTDRYNSDPARYTNSDALHNFMLQMLGRFVNNGSFETGAKPYESITISGLQTLYSYAHVLFPNDKRAVNVHKAAENALNLLAAQFAFQSVGGKRLGPMRRNYDNKDRMNPYANDYLPNIFGVLSGAYNYDDGNYAANVGTNDQPIAPYRPYMYQKIDQAGAFALWSCLMDYRIPEIVHDFMIKGTTGHWMRLNPHFLRGDRNYGYEDEFIKYLYGHYDTEYRWQNVGTPENPSTIAFPTYTLPNGAYLNVNNRLSNAATFNGSAQLFFVTPKFANVAGGYGNKYYSDETPILGGFVFGWPRKTTDVLRVYDFLAKPSFILPQFDIGINDTVNAGKFNSDSLEKFTITMRGGGGATSRNLWTYKSFAYGYYHEGEHDRHLDWPQRYPTSWVAALPDFVILRAVFRIFDFRNANPNTNPLAGNYLVINRMSKNNEYAWWRDYARGIWEVVPGSKYSNVTALKNYITTRNPESFYDHDEGHNFQYVMASTGETLELDRAVGSSRESPNGIVSIKNSAGIGIPLGTYLVDRTSEATISAAGLMDVWEVDANYNFTGTKFVNAGLMGQMSIWNPRIKKSLEINGTFFSTPWSVKKCIMPDAGTLTFVSNDGGGIKVDAKGNIQHLFIEKANLKPLSFQNVEIDAFVINSLGEFNSSFLYRRDAPPSNSGLMLENTTTGVSVQLQTDGTFSTPANGEFYSVLILEGSP